jgi:hypothetical protein
MTQSIKRREFITLLGGAAAAWPMAARAQQSGQTRRVAVLMGVARDTNAEVSFTTFVQGLHDRTQPGLPMKPGRAGTMSHDYKRHGTTTLFAALNVLDGTVIGHNMQRHRHQEFIRFLNAKAAGGKDGMNVPPAVIDEDSELGRRYMPQGFEFVRARPPCKPDRPAINRRR